MGLSGQTTGRSTAAKDLAGRRPIEVFMCSVKNKTGYGEGKLWPLRNHVPQLYMM